MIFLKVIDKKHLDDTYLMSRIVLWTTAIMTGHLDTKLLENFWNPSKSFVKAFIVCHLYYTIWTLYIYDKN